MLRTASEGARHVSLQVLQAQATPPRDQATPPEGRDVQQAPPPSLQEPEGEETNCGGGANFKPSWKFWLALPRCGKFLFRDGSIIAAQLQ